MAKLGEKVEEQQKEIDELRLKIGYLKAEQSRLFEYARKNDVEDAKMARKINETIDRIHTLIEETQGKVNKACCCPDGAMTAKDLTINMQVEFEGTPDEATLRRVGEELQKNVDSALAKRGIQIMNQKDIAPQQTLYDQLVQSLKAADDGKKVCMGDVFGTLQAYRKAHLSVYESLIVACLAAQMERTGYEFTELSFDEIAERCVLDEAATNQALNGLCNKGLVCVTTYSPYSFGPKRGNRMVRLWPGYQKTLAERIATGHQ